MPTQQTKYTVARTDEILDSILPLVTVVADGSTNDAPAIQAEINRLSALGGGTVVLPAGVIAIESTLLISKSNIRLVGQGADINHDTGGSQGLLAGTTLKWIGDTLGATVSAVQTVDSLSADGTVVTIVNPSEVAGHNGIFVDQSGNEYRVSEAEGLPTQDFRLAQDCSGTVTPAESCEIFLPSIMVQVTSDNANAQKSSGSSVSDILFDGNDLASIGLNINNHNEGKFTRMFFLRIKHATVLVSANNEDDAVQEAHDPQRNALSQMGCRIDSPSFCDGMVFNGNAGGNASLNTCENLKMRVHHGSAYCFEFSDHNIMNSCASTVTGDGNGIIFKGSFISDTNIARRNAFTHYSGSAKIVCEGTAPIVDTVTEPDPNPDLEVYTYVTYPSHTNLMSYLDKGNSTPQPLIAEGSTAMYSFDDARLYNHTMMRGVIVDNEASFNALANDDPTRRTDTESLRIVNGSNNHLIFDTLAEGQVEWGFAAASSGDLSIVRKGAIKTNFIIGAPTKVNSLAVGVASGGVPMTNFQGVRLITNGETATLTNPAPLEGTIWTIKNTGTADASIVMGGSGAVSVDGDNSTITLPAKEWLTVISQGGNYHKIGGA